MEVGAYCEQLPNRHQLTYIEVGTTGSRRNLASGRMLLPNTQQLDLKNQGAVGSDFSAHLAVAVCKVWWKE